MKKTGWKNLSRDGQNTHRLQEQLPDHNIHILTAAVLISSLGPSTSGCFIFSHLPWNPTFHGIMTGYHESWELAMNHGRPGLPLWLSSKESTCDAGDSGSIPGSGRSPGRGHSNHSRILAWRIPWTEEPGRLQSIGLQRVGHS